MSGKMLSDRDIIKAAKKAGMDVRDRPGSHFCVTAPDGQMMTCYHSGEISKGVSCKIRKWFLRFGVLLCFAVAAWVMSGV